MIWTVIVLVLLAWLVASALTAVVIAALGRSGAREDRARGFLTEGS